MSYIFSVNNLPSTGSVAIYSLISTLISAGWTKIMDSDGSTYSSSGTQVTSGASGANGLGNTKAWVRLQAPAVNGGATLNQTREITFQRGVANLDWRVKYSASAKFTGGSPGILITPSSADEVFMLGGGTDASPTFNTNWFSAEGAYHWHIACGGLAESYSFIAFSVALGLTTTFRVCIALDIMCPGSYSILDIDPAVMYCSTSGGSNSSISELITTISDVVANTTAPALARAWLGPTSAVGASVTSNNVNVQIMAYSVMGTGNISVNPWGLNDDLLPCVYVRKPATASSPSGIKGISTLFMFGSVNRQNLHCGDFSKSGARDKIFFGNLWLPWSGATPSI